MDGETRYILTGDLKTITHAISILRDLIPENNEVVDKKEYISMMSDLRKWQTKIFDFDLTENGE